MKKSLLTLCFALALLKLSAQDSTTASGSRFLGTRWQNGKIGFIIGTYGEKPYPTKHFSTEEPLLAKPNQQFLPYDRNNFITNYNYPSAGTFINPYISFHPWNKKKNTFNKKQEFRLGIIYYGRTVSYGNNYKENKTGDTTVITSVRFDNRRDDLGINIGYVTTSNKFWRHFSLYTGIDLGITYSITHCILQTLDVNTYVSQKIYFNNSYTDQYYSNTNSSNDSKKLKALSSVSMRGNIVGGLNLRIGSPVTFFTEARLGYSYYQPISGLAFLQNHLTINFGFKFKV